ncbi:MAG: hypothetical protein BWY61_02173 [Firmicutes bacterium ADurb.Bin354]|nr:MAG: hypothetical protein BWY61_02173 [Firmicutes bacterium ADurb.Bin354]
MNSGSLDMLHYSRYQDIFSITYRINFKFLALQIFINENRMLLRITVDDCHELFYFLIRDCDLHALSAKHI